MSRHCYWVILYRRVAHFNRSSQYSLLPGENVGVFVGSTQRAITKLGFCSGYSLTTLPSTWIRTKGFVDGFCALNSSSVRGPLMIAGNGVRGSGVTGKWAVILDVSVVIGG